MGYGSCEQVHRFKRSTPADGKAWTSIGTDAIPMADTVYVGIATTSHKTSQATDVMLESLTITPAGSSSNQPPQAAITSPADGFEFHSRQGHRRDRGGQRCGRHHREG